MEKIFSVEKKNLSLSRLPLLLFLLWGPALRAHIYLSLQSAILPHRAALFCFCSWRACSVYRAGVNSVPALAVSLHHDPLDHLSSPLDALGRLWASLAGVCRVQALVFAAAFHLVLGALWLLGFFSQLCLPNCFHVTSASAGLFTSEAVCLDAGLLLLFLEVSGSVMEPLACFVHCEHS